MRCPYCDKEAVIEDRVKWNLEAYPSDRGVKARTSCCGKLIRVYAVVSFRCKETDQRGKDDWGK